MKQLNSGFSTTAALISAAATLCVVALIWFALQNSDERIWLVIGLLMALSPFALVWRLVRNEKSKQQG